MRFKIDENAPFSVKHLLESRGSHQADSVYHQGKAGNADQDLLDLCLKEKRILITLDTDFRNAFLHPRGTFYGIILVRSHTQGKTAFLKLFREFLNQITTGAGCEQSSNCGTTSNSYSLGLCIECNFKDSILASG